jgi:hypothetical protein
MASYTVIPRLDNRAEVLTVNRLEDIEEEAAVNERRESLPLYRFFRGALNTMVLI